MGEHTDIEWCDSSLQLEMGCDGCELWNPKVGEKTCYAGQLTNLHGGPGKKGWPDAFDKPRIFPERLQVARKWKNLRGTERPNKPWFDGYPRMIFLDDMGDTFTESLPLYWLAEYLEAMGTMACIWMLLTKRANRMLEFSKRYPFPKNFWLMTSVTSAANYNRIEQLMEVQGGSVRGVSYEPAWGPVDFTKWMRPGGLDWIISGGSSGPSAKPAHPYWFTQQRDDCERNGVAYFHKQWGEWGPLPDIRHYDRYREHRFDDDTSVYRVGKKLAGAMIDGRRWTDVPPWVPIPANTLAANRTFDNA